MIRRRRETESFNISFLDVISAGFGAILLLLMISENSAPVSQDQTPEPESRPIEELQQELFEVRGETDVLNRMLNAKREQLSAYEERIARLRQDLSEIRGEYRATQEQSEQMQERQSELAVARQSLTEEMERLLAQQEQEPDNNMIGGVPVDSEYVIFIIDTSGSMQYNAWGRVLSMVEEILDVYPEVQGMQVLNDMGDYMFSSYRGQWIPDTPQRRETIINTLRNWAPFSNSSPVEGITRAINTFWSPDQQVSIYVFGDDFMPGGSITQVIETVDRMNRTDDNNERMVRIHAVGFPVLFQLDSRFQQSVYEFATLMRELTQRNGGSFVGLSSFE